MDQDVHVELASSIRQLTEILEDLLKYGRDTAAESTEEFVNGKITKLFGMAIAYQKCLKRIGVSTKEELEEKVQKYSGNKEVLQAGCELLDIEDRITSAGGRVIVVSFGIREFAQRWLQDVHCPFPMVLDADRKIYHSFGLKRSTLKVWGVSSLVYYAEAMVAGKPLPKPYENVHDDTEQMGGDFIIDSRGNVSFLYPSKTNRDRPSIDLLEQTLKKTHPCKL